ncbi:MAG: VanZ family protein [Proteobacteria bacterium]|nr:VanZ family protein [Pseudomonadota bacterium]
MSLKIARIGLRSAAWLAILLTGIAALFVLGAQPIAVGLFPPPYDKLAHLVVFAAFFVALDRSLVMPIWLAAAIPLLLSAADEVHQVFLPGRQPGLDDWLAGLCGVSLAVIWRVLRR